jgi:apolipoprotein N-acyltransferase
MKGTGRQKNGFQSLGLALGSSLLLFLSFPGAAGFWPLAWVALVPLLWAVRDTEPGKAAKLGLLTGMVHYVSLLYWIVIVLGKYGNLAWWISVPGLLLLALYMSCYLALFSAAISWVWKKQPSLVVWFGPFIWVALDYVRSFLFSGFPWQDLGYSQYKSLLLIQTADLTGHYGITFYLVLVNCLSVLFLTLWMDSRAIDPQQAVVFKQRYRQAFYFSILPAVCAILTVMAYNLLRYNQMLKVVETSPAMSVAVVQGNIRQDQKWSPAMRSKTMEIYTGLSEKAIKQGGSGPVLLVWPETAMPFYINNNVYYKRLVKQLIEKYQVWLLAGAPHVEIDDSAPQRGEKSRKRYYNSAFLVSPTGEISGRYDKQHLVPFGEYIPLGKYLPLPGPLVENIGDFSSGKSSTPLSCQSAKIGVLICFESIFPKLAREMSANGANLLANITNDAWFGRSSAPWQHMSMAVFRAVENRRSLARAANTGISTIIDPLGRETGVSPLFEPFFHVVEIPLLEKKTVFTRFGHHFGLFCLLALLPFVALAKKTKNN